MSFSLQWPPPSGFANRVNATRVLQEARRALERSHSRPASASSAGPPPQGSPVLLLHLLGNTACGTEVWLDISVFIQEVYV